MLIICEDCAKKYNIDESRISGNRARFTCKACGHIIIVNKSDTNRPLISSASSIHASFDDSGTIDLLKEMEASSFSEMSPEKPAPDENNKPVQDSQVPAKGKPVLAYILTGILAAFICINGALGYLYIVTFSGILEQQSSAVQADLFKNTALSLGVAWFITLTVFFVIARSIAQPITALKENVNRIIQGKDDINIAAKGPGEIRELASALSKMRKDLP